MGEEVLISVEIAVRIVSVALKNNRRKNYKGGEEVYVHAS